MTAVRALLLFAPGKQKLRLGKNKKVYRPPLRVSPESIDFTRDPEQVEGQGAKHRVEACKKAKMLSCRRLFTKLQNS